MKVLTPALLFLCACSDDPRAADVADSAIEADASLDTSHDIAPEVDAEPEGPAVFEVVLIETGTFAFAIAGKIFEESTADGITRGECTFYPAHLPPFCDPACAIGTVCRERDDAAVCVDPDVPLGAGDITVTGLTVGLTLHPETQYFYYSPTYTPAEPSDGNLFEPGASIVASATGGNVPAFAIDVRGVDDTATTLACPPTFTKGQGLQVRWTAGAVGAVHFDLESGNHGGQFARIACDGPDDGAFDIDAELLDRYIDAARPLDLWRLERHNTRVVGSVRVRAASQAACRW